jgi:hypothetical protein
LRPCSSRVGGKDKERIRDRTPLPFRDLLVGIAMSCATAGVQP